MHEFAPLLRYARAAHLARRRCVLASLVHVDGSSYRKPGVRMIVTATGSAGAVSGGCVERAVEARAQAVLRTGRPEVMVYDGRYRLGCEGYLYLVLEPFDPPEPDALFDAFDAATDPEARDVPAVTLTTAFAKTDGVPTTGPADLGTVVTIGAERFPLRRGYRLPPENAPLPHFRQRLRRPRRLFAVGAERDAVALAELAHHQGFATTLVTHPRNPLTGEGLDYRVAPTDPPELLELVRPDERAAVVLMTHNFARDLAYAASLADGGGLGYLGLMGPAHRRDRLFAELADVIGEVPTWMRAVAHGPAGLDLGGERPEQVALSIIAEATAVSHGRSGDFLRNKRGRNHESV